MKQSLFLAFFRVYPQGSKPLYHSSEAQAVFILCHLLINLCFHNFWGIRKEYGEIAHCFLNAFIQSDICHFHSYFVGQSKSYCHAKFKCMSRKGKRFINISTTDKHLSLNVSSSEVYVLMFFNFIKKSLNK